MIKGCSLSFTMAQKLNPHDDYKHNQLNIYKKQNVIVVVSEFSKYLNATFLENFILNNKEFVI